VTASGGMRAAVWAEGGALREVRLPIPEPGAGEVRVRVRACGICGSDLHLRHTGFAQPGLAPGHEFAGVVDAVGPGVAGLAPGTGVAVEPLASCGACEECRKGLDALCRSAKLFGIGLHGGFAEQVVVPAARAFPVPADLDPRVAALAEPVAVVVRGLRRGGIGEGSRVLVLGAGTLGLLSILAAKALGAADVWISARHAAQAALAKDLGAGRVLAEAEAAPQELARAARKAPFDVVLETVGGTANTLDAAGAAVRRGGTVAVLGMFTERVALDTLPLLLKEATLAWSYCYGRTHEPCEFAAATRLLAAERERAARLVTHTVPLAEAARAFDLAADRRSGAIKVTVVPSAAQA
jgi:threonine dehydrogenase-like Zn-dependent dehydrogenase